MSKAASVLSLSTARGVAGGRPTTGNIFTAVLNGEERRVRELLSVEPAIVAQVGLPGVAIRVGGGANGRVGADLCCWHRTSRLGRLDRHQAAVPGRPSRHEWMDAPHARSTQSVSLHALSHSQYSIM